ncbi:ScyD/ScyE family protein [Dyadobacter sp. CY323]|uniref:ScyD/ScyE family protein n=1 Tax=Dyadobacter sp. CY323 TaxID=2907302 RepID=UPI001F402AA2|nr:ScyD/ScyE family protein [Dyadobacter sp. CY323]MCE6987605.1 ScyD/ScyE family protein [Dyadobacter sp. CY323]
MKKRYLQAASLYLLLFVGVLGCVDHELPEEQIPEPTSLTAAPFANGLRFPIGMDVDDKGNLWVSEAGTGKDDGAIVMITPGGQKTTVLEGFKSAKGNEAVEGISHVLYDKGTLFILHGIEGKLYIADVSNFKAGDLPMALNLIPFEEHGPFVKSFSFTDPLNSNLYGLTLGPDGHLYMTDAGANAIFKRDKNTKEFTFFAKIPDVAPKTDAVATGIVFDGTKFLVSTLSGGPFFENSAKIFEVSTSGVVKIYRENFTTLTHLTLTAGKKPLVISLAKFDLKLGEFTPFSGTVRNESGDVLLDNQMMPTDIKRSGPKEFYLLSYALGTVQKLTY